MNNIILNNQKIVGSIKDGIYKKNVTKEKHFFRKFNGYGISKCVLEKLQEEGVSKIEITEKDTKDKYTCDLEQYLKQGKEFLNKDDTQLVLNINHFQKEN